MSKRDSSKLGANVVFLIILIQAIAAGGFYLYCSINKWKIREAFTVFLYPIFNILLFVFILLSFVVSLSYFVKKIADTKKFYHSIPVLVILIFLILSSIFFSESKLRQYDFKKYQYIRQEIVEQIMSGKLVPYETGTVNLPDEYSDEEIARGGRVYIIDYEKQKGIYFCTFSGVLESSAGFVFLTEDVGAYTGINNTVALQEQYAAGWYYCGTGSR